ncbi:hypothetical protein T484DRAFT_1633126, partial [Baffinella frigidus]
GIVRSMAAFHLPGARKDCLVICTYSRRIFVLGFNTERKPVRAGAPRDLASRGSSPLTPPALPALGFLSSRW